MSYRTPYAIGRVSGCCHIEFGLLVYLPPLEMARHLTWLPDAGIRSDQDELWFYAAFYLEHVESYSSQVFISVLLSEVKFRQKLTTL